MANLGVCLDKSRSLRISSWKEDFEIHKFKCTQKRCFIFLCLKRLRLVLVGVVRGRVLFCF